MPDRARWPLPLIRRPFGPAGWGRNNAKGEPLALPHTKDPSPEAYLRRLTREIRESREARGAA